MATTNTVGLRAADTSGVARTASRLPSPTGLPTGGTTTNLVGLRAAQSQISAGTTPPVIGGTPLTADASRMEDLFKPMELEFIRFAEGPLHTNAGRLTHRQRREYRSFLMDPTRKPRGQTEQNMRTRARTKYMLVGNQLYRQPGDEPDDADGKASNQPRRVIMLEAAYSTIRRTHELIGPHAGVNKTWAEVQLQYFGINKKEVQWVIKHCEVCQANIQPSNNVPPIQMIRSSVVNER